MITHSENDILRLFDVLEAPSGLPRNLLGEAASRRGLPTLWGEDGSRRGRPVPMKEVVRAAPPSVKRNRKVQCRTSVEEEYVVPARILHVRVPSARSRDDLLRELLHRTASYIGLENVGTDQTII
ncbi:hypothetical protein SASPL_103518 [Salvia splendens]|uniref:Uncharacterized protein n=1 Tax=Salvia splendens TaxID=180675 RepID=A0A8X8YGA4_SALSN|nr:hypothetical protein SASPL_103518 [Salvia splendens]